MRIKFPAPASSDWSAAWIRRIWLLGVLGVALAGFSSIDAIRRAPLINVVSLRTRHSQHITNATFGKTDAWLTTQLERDQSSATYRRLGHALLLQGDIDRAVEVLSAGAERYPRDQLLHHILGDALQVEGDSVRALQEWRLAGVPAAFLAQRGLAFVPLSAQLSGDAMLELASALWPGSSNAWLELGRVHMSAGRQLLAVESFRTALQTNTWTYHDDGYVSEYGANFYLGFMYLALGQPIEAVQHFERCLELSADKRDIDTSGDRPRLHQLLGITAHQLGHNSVAVHHLLEAVRLGARDAETLKWLALANNSSAR
jgi:tetratricopeptide (TPR) repeat protein